MAFIYLPAAFIYLLPAAVFLWLGNEMTIKVYKYVARYVGIFFEKVKILFKKIKFDKIKSVFSGITNKIKKAITNIRTKLTAKSAPQAQPEPEPLPTPIPKSKTKSKQQPQPEPEPLPEIAAPAPVIEMPYYESDDVTKQLDDLDMITISAMAIMLSDTKAKTASPYIKSMTKADIKVVLLRFLKETFNATDIGQLNRLFNKHFYKKKIRRYMRRILAFVKGGISDSLPKRNMWLIKRMRISGKQMKTYVDKICETINSFESVKYISALSGNKETSDSKRNYKLDHLSDNYKDALIYMVDFLLTCTCISKMLFVERMIRRMPVDSEFKKIIDNMANSIEDHNLIISKSRPVYKQYYQAELGYISGDDFLYGMAITIMVNNIKKKEPLNPDNQIKEYSNLNYHMFEGDMKSWLDELAKDDKTIDIGTLILQVITLSIKNNYGLLISALSELLLWENYYKQRVEFNKREKDKERYLRGDFENEVLEITKFKQIQ